MARRLVDSNLVGHDSHGVLRVSKYLEWMREGNLLPNRTPSLVFDSDTIAIVDGQRGFGQVIGEYAGTLGGHVADRHCAGRIAQLRSPRPPRRLGGARRRRRSRVDALFRPPARSVAPFGGGDRRLSTNPLCVGIPQAGGGRSSSTSPRRRSPRAS